MEIKGTMKIRTMDEFSYYNKTVLLRTDINSPIDTISKKITNNNRLKMSAKTIKEILEQGGKLAIIAHQGDTLDYHNLIPLVEHAKILSDLVGIEIKYIDDVAGPAAQEMVRKLKPGEGVLLGNLRYLTEEVSTFENYVKLDPIQMQDTYLVRNLAPLCDYYINDAFAAAHRSSPSMIGFQEILPSAGGRLLIAEVNALLKIMKTPIRPLIFVLGGAKASDAFSMMKQVLQNGIADKILCCGIIGEIMLLAKGIPLGVTTESFIKDKGFDIFVKQAKEYLKDYFEKIHIPVDLAYEEDGIRREIIVEDLPQNEMFMDIGKKTISNYEKMLENAGTIFANGPAGVYENKLFQEGTKRIFNAIAKAEGYSVIGGGDTVSAASKFIQINEVDHISTAGGAMINFLSGKKLPLIDAMEKSYERIYIG